MMTCGRPTVTFTSAPGFETSTLFVAASYETDAPIASNIERSGTRIVPPRTRAARIRFARILSGVACTCRSLKRIGTSAVAPPGAALAGSDVSGGSSANERSAARRCGVMRCTYDDARASAYPRKSPAFRRRAGPFSGFLGLEVNAQAAEPTAMRERRRCIRFLESLVADVSAFDEDRSLRDVQVDTTPVLFVSVLELMAARGVGIVAAHQRVVQEASEDRDDRVEVRNLLDSETGAGQVRVTGVVPHAVVADDHVQLRRFEDADAAAHVEVAILHGEAGDEGLASAAKDGYATRVAVVIAAAIREDAGRYGRGLMRVVELLVIEGEQSAEVADRERETGVGSERRVAGIPVAELVVCHGAEDAVAGDPERGLLNGRRRRAGGRWRWRRRRRWRCRGWRRGRRRRWRRSRRNVTHDDDALLGNPQDVRAHAFRDHANRNDDRTLVDLGRNVERTALAVNHGDGTSDRYLNVGPGFCNVDRLCRRIIRIRFAHLLEHRTQRNEDGASAHESGQESSLLQSVGLRVNMLIVIKNRNFARRRRTEVWCRLLCEGRMYGRCSERDKPERSRRPKGEEPR